MRSIVASFAATLRPRITNSHSVRVVLILCLENMTRFAKQKKVTLRHRSFSQPSRSGDQGVKRCLASSPDLTRSQDLPPGSTQSNAPLGLPDIQTLSAQESNLVPFPETERCTLPEGTPSQDYVVLAAQFRITLHDQCNSNCHTNSHDGLTDKPRNFSWYR